MGLNRKPDLTSARWGAFLLAASALLSCAPGEKSLSLHESNFDSSETLGGTYVEASIADASFLNPLLATDSASSDINSKVFNSLIKYDENLVLVGELAESFRVEEKGKKITFKLREGVRWHDGKPFTSADVLFTYKALISSNTRTAFASDYLIVKSASAPDPLTFIVTYNEPFAPALESWGMRIIPKHIYEGKDINTHPANRNPIGTGPYIFQDWKTDEKIVLIANDDYFEGRPFIDKYIYRIIPDQAVQFLELRQGSLGSMSLTPDQYRGYDEFFRYYNKYRFPAFRYDYIGLNLKNPLFQDVRVRKALAHAVNKKEIIDGVYRGLAVPSTGPFPPRSWAWNPEVPDHEYDLALSRKLLAEAGWTDSDGDGFLDKDGQPFAFTLSTNQGNKVRESITQIVQNDWSKLGIKVDIRILEWSVFIQKYIDKRQFDAVLLAWNLSIDPDGFSIWHSSQMDERQYNFVSYKNDEVDRLLLKGRAVFDKEERKKIYHRIHELIAEDVPYIFLVTPEALPVVHKKIMGVKEAPAGIGWNFEKWWIPKAFQGKHRITS